MRDDILKSLEDPETLEKLYRNNRAAFKQAFDELYSEIKGRPVAAFWFSRLHYEKTIPVNKGNYEIRLVVFLALLAGLIAKIPDFAGINNPELFYPYNISFIVFPILILYFIWKRKSQINKMAFSLIVIIASAVYMNILPKGFDRDTTVLACMHMPLFLWAVTGYAFLGNDLRNHLKRIQYLRFNGDLLIMINILLLAGGVFSGVTIGLFNLIDMNIEKFYTEYVMIFGASATPVVGTYLVLKNPTLVQKVSPIIARIFTPFALIMLTIYLVAVVYTGRDPYNDRGFLLLFNALLVGVMALIFFSLSEFTSQGSGKFSLFVLLGLSALTLIVNIVALSAIFFRLNEWGISPNRIAVLGGNLLIFINLLIVTFRLLNVVRKKSTIAWAEEAIAVFLPIYGIWFAFVTFFFPILFGFK